MAMSYTWTSNGSLCAYLVLMCCWACFGSRRLSFI